MKNLQIKTNPLVEIKINAYPEVIQGKLLYLRSLIMEVAEEDENVQEMEETLKWGEPSYLTKNGSTIRIDWKAKTPDQYAVYFKCTSKLVTTFRAVYGDQFKYEANRAIIFGLEDTVPAPALKDCLRMALNYHLLKNRPYLGKKI